MKKNVIFLGAGPTSLAGIWELSSFDFNIFVVGYNKHEIGRYSRFVKYLGSADPENESNKLLEILLDYSSSQDHKASIIPTGDEYVEFLYENKKVLSKHYNASVFKNNWYETIIDKELFSKTCMKLNIPQPNTWYESGDLSLNDWAESARYPCIIKPRIYHHWKKHFGLKKGFIVNNIADLLSTTEKIKKIHNDIIVQEIIQGEDDKIVIFSCNISNGNVKQIFTGRKYRQYPYGFGTTTLAKSEQIDEIIDDSISLLSSINYSGVCDVEYKYDQLDGQYKIIEINPRIGRWYRLVTQSNKYPLVSSIYEMVDNNNGKESLSDTRQTYGKIWIFIFRDLFVINKNKNISKTELLKYYFFRKKIHCVYNYRDIMPAIMYIFEIFMKYYHHKNRDVQKEN